MLCPRWVVHLAAELGTAPQRADRRQSPKAGFAPPGLAVLGSRRPRSGFTSWPNKEKACLRGGIPQPNLGAHLPVDTTPPIGAGRDPTN